MFPDASLVSHCRCRSCRNRRKHLWRHLPPCDVSYWHDDDTLHDVIARMHSLEHGGTFAVYLACDALRKGYSATIYTYNLLVFDPTWFEEGVDIARSRSVCRR